MKVGLNLLHARSEIGGAWNYIANIIQALKLADAEFEFVAYCTSLSEQLVPDDPRFGKKLVRISGSSQIARILYEQTVLPFRALADGVQCMHWFANVGPLMHLIPSVVTIHDMMFLDNPVDTPTGLSRGKKLYLREMARHTCRNAEALAPVSETTAGVVDRLFGPDHQRVFVIRNPLDQELRRSPTERIERLRERYALPPQFWLYVAHPYPHKNHLRLFEAYKTFRDRSPSNWPLVLRGDREKRDPSLERATISLGIGDSVVWLPRLSQEDMTDLYSAAGALVFPSLYEGGGIPVLEAMACGCPVVASDIPTSKEFAGDAALLFDATNADSMAEAMLRFFREPSLRESCVAKGLIRAERYSSKNVIAKLLAAYRYSAQNKAGLSEERTRNVQSS
jgi:glycosyltransferase involved in cell wall biosynthesis